MKYLRQLIAPRPLSRVIFVLAILIWPLVYHSNYALSNTMVAGLFALLAMSTNLIMGQAGQLSFGAAAFAGIGGYTTALTTARLHWPPLGGLALGVILAVVVALIVGKPVLRLRLYFLAMATMALVTIFTVVVTMARSVTFGPTGVPGIPELGVGSLQVDGFRAQYYFVWIIVLALLLFFELALRSRVGRALRALSTSETAASTLGIDTAAWKLRTFVVSAAVAGLAGGLYVFFLTSSTPSDFSLSVSITVVIMVLIGGMDSLLGAAIGAILITWVSFSMGQYQQYSTGIYAAILIACLLFAPKGLAGLRAFDRLFSVRSVLSRGLLKRIQAVPVTSAAGRAPAVGGAGSGADRAQGSADPVAGASAPAITVKPVAQERVRLEGVGVSFGGLEALSNVSIETEIGSITAIIGPNGAGKTTLFNVISGLQKPTTGHVWYRGKDLTRMAPAGIARLGLARTFQNLRLFGNMTVLENVMVGRHRHEDSHFVTAGLRLPSQRREELRSRDYCHDALALVGLADRAEEMATSLPYGQQRLLEIARALATEPSLLLLDEPAAGMNAHERAMLAEKILQISKAGIDILLVEHDMEVVMGLSHHVVVLDHGRVICEGSPDHVQCQPEVIKAYLGESDHFEASRLTRAERRAKSAVDVTPERILKVKNLSTRYGAIEALRGVSLHVNAGECVAVLGANGAGKTTLLRTIAGSLNASSGHVIFGGADITRLSAPEVVELGVCQVLEGRHVFPTLSVQDNLMLGAGKIYKGKAFQEELASVFDLFPILAERRRQLAGSLSGGEQQMLAIGRTLMGRPRIMLLDEPSMGLAPLVVQAIFDALLRLNERGLTVLMVEQNAKAALSIADRALVLVTGEVALEGTSEELMEDPRLSALYLGG